MNTNQFLTFNALICFGFSFLLIFFPTLFTGFFVLPDTQLTGFGLFLARAYGCLIFAEGFCFWMGKQAKHGTKLWDVVLWFSFLSNASTAVIYLIGYINHEANIMLLPVVFFVGSLTLMAAYLLFFKQHAAVH